VRHPVAQQEIKGRDNRLEFRTAPGVIELEGTTSARRWKRAPSNVRRSTTLAPIHTARATVAV